MHKSIQHHINTIGHISNSINTRYSESVNTFNIRYKRETQRLNQAASALANMHENKNPLETSAAHFKKISIHAKRLENEIYNTENRLPDIQIGLANDIDKRINEKLNLSEDKYGEEFRETLRNMETKKRYSAIQKVIESGDSKCMAAIAKAPPILSGIDQEMHSRYIENYQTRYAPELINERNQFLETITDLSSMISSTKKLANAFLDPERLQNIEQDEQSAIEAESNFNQAFSTN